MLRWCVKIKLQTAKWFIINSWLHLVKHQPHLNDQNWSSTRCNGESQHEFQNQLEHIFTIFHDFWQTNIYPRKFKFGDKKNSRDDINKHSLMINTTSTYSTYSITYYTIETLLFMQNIKKNASFLFSVLLQ